MANRFDAFRKKRIASLKRNFYNVPFIMICVSCFFFLGSLFILIKSVGRIEYKPTAIFLFIAVLASILTIVAIVSYVKKVYGQKRPLKMLIAYYIMVAVCLAFVITIFYFNDQQILSEIAKRDALKPLPSGEMPAEWYTFQTFINYGVCSRTLMIIFFAFEFIANGLLMAAPLFEKKLKSINFDQAFDNEKQS